MNKLPNWVYETLKRYGNVALPNFCNDMDREELKKDIERNVGFKVVIKEIEITECGNDMRNHTKFKPFLKVEAER